MISLKRNSLPGRLHSALGDFQAPAPCDTLRRSSDSESLFWGSNYVLLVLVTQSAAFGQRYRAFLYFTDFSGPWSLLGILKKKTGLTVGIAGQHSSGVHRDRFDPQPLHPQL